MENSSQECVLEDGTAIGMTEPTRANSGISKRVVARCKRKIAWVSFLMAAGNGSCCLEGLGRREAAVHIEPLILRAQTDTPAFSRANR